MYGKRRFFGKNRGFNKAVLSKIYYTSILLLLVCPIMGHGQDQEAETYIRMIQAYQQYDSAQRAEIKPVGPLPMRQQVIINNYDQDKIVTPDNYENPYNEIYK